MTDLQCRALLSVADVKPSTKSMLRVQVVFYLKQMSPEEVDEKYANVMHQRHMFVYTTE